VSQAATEPSAGEPPPRTRLFLSYGRADAKELADRLRADLESRDYEVWLDTKRIRGGTVWSEEIEDGLRSTQIAIALLSPHAVRKTGDPHNPDAADSVCLDELSFARFVGRPGPSSRSWRARVSRRS